MQEVRQFHDNCQIAMCQTVATFNIGASLTTFLLSSSLCAIGVISPSSDINLEKKPEMLFNVRHYDN